MKASQAGFNLNTEMVIAYEVHCGLLFGMDSSRVASPVVLVVKNLPTHAGDLTKAGSVPGLGRSPAVGSSNNPLQ